jgi:hypothetical protein
MGRCSFRDRHNLEDDIKMKITEAGDDDVLRAFEYGNGPSVLTRGV